MLSQFVFLIPLGIAFVLLLQLLWSRRRKLKLKPLGRLYPKSILQKVVYAAEKYLLPSKASRAYSLYEGLLTYSKLTVGEFFAIKYVIIFIASLLIFSIHITNVSIYTKEIYTKYDLQGDELFSQSVQVLDEVKALEAELHYLKKSIGLISKKDSTDLPKEEIQGRILGLVLENSESLVEAQLPPMFIANRVYYRLYHYYQVRNFNYPYAIFVLILLYFLPDLFSIIYNYFIRADVRKELRFLKRLIILNGSIKPVNFLEVLTILMGKSKYYRKFLKEVENQNKKNTISNSDIYRKYIDKEQDIDVKLFFEKLDQANNYDFDQAIVNIENEFNIEKRQRIRNVKRQIEIINAWGIVGCFLLIGLLTMYMLIPWLQAYNMNQMF
ncbi:hypothetical protein [Alkaliphilus hydrothermalis]|uniref:Uncharacterized protein n=1 Tax=Alkaliphilus hydrothermalis TaxID=1482730 RepID=A0ABS2NLY7_9FIRM|nr:hypothetical protein [Alkaliphilus hydrothermalis]MBM7613599.1 hypothetical protein [Alkaliphilus hydrothermalis]